MHTKRNKFLLVIHVFDLIPGASRQNEVTTCHTKTTVQQVAVTRAGAINDQYMVFIDANRDIFCTSLKNGSNFEIHKIGTAFRNVQLNCFALESKCLNKQLVSQVLKCFQQCGPPNRICSSDCMMLLTPFGIALAKHVRTQRWSL